jgi:hypothetical protein
MSQTCRHISGTVQPSPVRVSARLDRRDASNRRPERAVSYRPAPVWRRGRRGAPLLGEHDHRHDRTHQPLTAAARNRLLPAPSSGRSRGRRDQRTGHRGNSLGRANVLDGSGVDNNFGSLSPCRAARDGGRQHHLCWFLGVIGRYDLNAGPLTSLHPNRRRFEGGGRRRPHLLDGPHQRHDWGADLADGNADRASSPKPPLRRGRRRREPHLLGEQRHRHDRSGQPDGGPRQASSPAPATAGVASTAPPRRGRGLPRRRPSPT